MPRFIPISGTIPRGRRQVSSSASVLDADVTDPKKLSELLRQALRRISDLEASQTPDTVDIELEVAANTDYRIYHGLGGPVRWWPVWWEADSFFSPDCTFYWVNTSDLENDHITLKAVNAGTVILRFELSQNQVTV